MGVPTADEFMNDYERQIKEMQDKMRDALNPIIIPPSIAAAHPPASPIVILVNIAQDMGLLTHSAANETPYIRIPGDGWRRPKFINVRSREFRELLLSNYYAECGDGVASDVVTQALDIIAGICMSARPNSRSPKKFVTKKGSVSS